MEINGNRPFEGYVFTHIFIAQKSRRLDRFCSGGFQPTEEKIQVFRSSIGTKHLNVPSLRLLNPILCHFPTG